MARSRKQGGKTSSATIPVMRPDATGIDISATEIFVAVPADRAAENVRSSPTFTQNLYSFADWLKPCGIKTVAMESTGVYWIPLFQIPEERGSMSGQRPAREERSREAHGCLRLPVAAVPACGGIAESLVSTGAGSVRHSIAIAAPGKPGPDGGNSRQPHAQSARPDECAVAPCD